MSATSSRAPRRRTATPWPAFTRDAGNAAQPASRPRRRRRDWAPPLDLRERQARRRPHGSGARPCPPRRPAVAGTGRPETPSPGTRRRRHRWRTTPPAAPRRPGRQETSATAPRSRRPALALSQPAWWPAPAAGGRRRSARPGHPVTGQATAALPPAVRSASICPTCWPPLTPLRAAPGLPGPRRALGTDPEQTPRRGPAGHRPGIAAEHLRRVSAAATRPCSPVRASRRPTTRTPCSTPSAAAPVRARPATRLGDRGRDAAAWLRTRPGWRRDALGAGRRRRSWRSRRTRLWVFRLSWVRLPGASDCNTRQRSRPDAPRPALRERERQISEGGPQ
jgi:hypothetical protein